MKYIVIIFISFLTLSADRLSVKSYNADFVQTIVTPDKKFIRYNGKLALRVPSFGYWAYKQPLQKEIFFNKNSITIIEHDLEQAIIKRLDDDANLIAILNHAKQIDKDKYMTIFNNIRYNIYIDNNKVAMIKYIDQLENSVTIEFSNIKQNKKIDNTVFRCNIPRGYDKIYQ